MAPQVFPRRLSRKHLVALQYIIFVSSYAYMHAASFLCVIENLLMTAENARFWVPAPIGCRCIHGTSHVIASSLLMIRMPLLRTSNR